MAVLRKSLRTEQYACFVKQQFSERLEVVGPRCEDLGLITLEQVGKIIGVTKERVRQIQNKALNKMRVTLEERFLAA